MNLVLIGGKKNNPEIKLAISDSISAAQTDARPASVLLVPSASTSETKYRARTNSSEKFFKELGISRIAILHGRKEAPSQTQFDELIGGAHLIYIIGGSTTALKSSQTWKMFEDELKKPKETRLFSDTALAGTSAGALALARVGQTLSERSGDATHQDGILEYTSGLGLYDGLIGVHGDTVPSGYEHTRAEELKSTLPTNETSGVSIANAMAIHVLEGTVRVVGDDSSISYLFQRSEDQTIEATRLTNGSSLAELG